MSTEKKNLKILCILFILFDRTNYRDAWTYLKYSELKWRKSFVFLLERLLNIHMKTSRQLLMRNVVCFSATSLHPGYILVADIFKIFKIHCLLLYSQSLFTNVVADHFLCKLDDFDLFPLSRFCNLEFCDWPKKGTLPTCMSFEKRHSYVNLWEKNCNLFGLFCFQPMFAFQNMLRTGREMMHFTLRQLTSIKFQFHWKFTVANSWKISGILRFFRWFVISQMKRNPSFSFKHFKLSGLIF